MVSNEELVAYFKHLGYHQIFKKDVDRIMGEGQNLSFLSIVGGLNNTGIHFTVFPHFSLEDLEKGDSAKKGQIVLFSMESFQMEIENFEQGISLVIGKIPNRREYFVYPSNLFVCPEEIVVQLMKGKKAINLRTLQALD